MNMATKKTRYHKHLAHDQGLLQTLIRSWLAILFISLILHKGFELLPDRISSFFPTFSFSHLTSRKDNDPSWKHAEFHGDVELFRRPIALVLEEYANHFSARATGLYAYRAVTALDIPIEALLHVFRDTPNSVTWTKDLKEAEVSHKSGAHHRDGNTQIQTCIVRHRYHVPIPGVSDREFYMKQKMTAIENSDGTHSKVTVELEPFNEEEYEIELFSQTCFDCIRATKLAKWTFTSLDEKSTKIELDVAADPAMPFFSSFFVNIYQKSWPHVTMHGLMNAARHHLHRDDDIQIANTMSRIFPLKM